MTQEHPITPPPELVEQWYKEWTARLAISKVIHVATKAARWGADQELEACCEWLRSSLPGCDKHYEDYLHTARRPKPPSLKEQALELVDRLEKAESPWVVMSELATIRRALEQLDD